MLLNDEVKTLRSLPLFCGVPSAKLKLLAFTSERMSFRPGEVLFHQGDVGDAAYVILSGRAAVLVESPEGQAQVAEVADNAIVGEIAILCNNTRSATVKALTTLEVLRIGKEQFLKLMSDFPDLMIEVVRVLASRLSQTTSELTETRARVAQGRG